MAKVESTVAICRPVEEVFRFFLDLDKNAPKTDPNVESVVKTPDGLRGLEQRSTFGRKRSGK